MPPDESKAVAPINPFAGGQRSTPTNVMVDAVQSREIAEIQGEMLIARRMPRDPMLAMDAILNEFTRPSLAEVAQYEYAKGGSDVRGPSIRAAEAIAQKWGNIRCGVRELEQRNGESTMEAFAWDLETGFHDVKVFQVPHVRYTRKGSYKIEDPREIYELTANQGARRKRACLLTVLPGVVVEAAMQQADVTLHTKAEVTPERLQALLEKFAPFGVTKDAVEKRIQRRLEAMTPAQMVNLGKIYNSLRDNMSAPADWFELEAPAGQSGGAASSSSKDGASALKDAAKKASGAKAGDSQQSGDTKSGDEKKPDTPIEVTHALVSAKIAGAKTTDELNEAVDLIKHVANTDHQKELRDAAKARAKELAKDPT